jgi:hypothetical protein
MKYLGFPSSDGGLGAHQALELELALGSRTGKEAKRESWSVIFTTTSRRNACVNFD